MDHLREQTSNSSARRWVLTLIAVALFALAVVDGLDGVGRSYAEASLKRALITFGVARGLDAVISVAQGTELAVQPAGIGLTLAPGEILDPVNDLVERFSSIALLAATSLGVQRVLLDVALWPPLTVALGVSLLAGLSCLWYAPLAGTLLARWVWAIAALLLLLRFAAPTMSVTSAVLFETFLAPRYAKATAQLEHTRSTLHELNEKERAAAPKPEQSILERAREALGAAGYALDVRARIDAFTTAAAHITDHTIDLIVVFVIETLLIPLAFLWLLLAALRRLVSWVLGSTP